MDDSMWIHAWLYLVLILYAVAMSIGWARARTRLEKSYETINRLYQEKAESNSGRPKDIWREYQRDAWDDGKPTHDRY